jgi:FkbM family methyltransferase
MRKTLAWLVRRGKFLKIAMTRKLTIGDVAYTVSAFRMNMLVKAAIAQAYEPWADEIIKSVFKIKPGAFIDVGANVGQTFLKVLKIDRNRRYIGFEPQTTGCSFINQFIMANRLTNHLILPVGLGREEGIARLGLREENDVTASMTENYRPEGFYCHYQYIPICRGDTVMERLGVDALSLIKIDVEGGELDVLHGLQESLAKFRPYVLFELLPNRLFIIKQELDDKIIAYRDERHRDMGRLLKASHYAMYQIRPGEGLKPIERLIADNTVAFNNICVPNEEVVTFEREFRIAI